MGYGHEKRFYKILKIRFLNDLASPNAKHFYTKCIPQKRIKQQINKI
jgi:hypothetical protein